MTGINVRTCFYRGVAFNGKHGTTGEKERKTGSGRVLRVYVCVYICQNKSNKDSSSVCVCVYVSQDRDARRKRVESDRDYIAFHVREDIVGHGSSRDRGSNRGS